jgi:hypothetical protein
MNPFHGLPLSLLLLPSFAFVLILMAAMGQPKKRSEKHRLFLLSASELEKSKQRSWFDHQAAA